MNVRPRRAAILALEGCYASSLTGFADVLQVANAHLRMQHGAGGIALARPFEWQFVSLGGRPVTACNGLSIGVNTALGEDVFDVVFIPGLYYAGRSAFGCLLATSTPQSEWLATQWQGGAVLAANCTGTFVLAETGLLNGRTATTTWWLERVFRARYPEVSLQPRAMVTEVDRLCCAGASASYLLQAVRMVEHFCGPGIAALTAKTMLIDTSQTTQLPFLPLQTEADHGDAMVARAQHWLQKHLGDAVKLPALASSLAVSERTLIRRFNSVLGATPLSYLQKLRTQTARTLLESSDLSVEAIARHVGYQNTGSFSRLFREHVGMTPGTYRNRFALGRKPLGQPNGEDSCSLCE